MQFVRDESGQDLTEYSLLLAFILMASAALVFSSTDAIKGIWLKTNSQLVFASNQASS